MHGLGETANPAAEGEELGKDVASILKTVHNCLVSI